jgi:NitT/TauT family transport system ATP-binding protein
MQAAQESATPGPVVDIRNLHKIYNPGPKQVEAVSGVSFTIRQGEFVSVLGPSGCGKSTLLMMAAGLESVTSGSLRINGTAVTGARRDTGIIFQDATLLPWKTALQNVMYPAEVMGRPLGPYRERAVELLRLMGLGDFLNKRPRELSGGMRQRVAICRALAIDPSLLLMDEPFSALDAITRDEMNMTLLDIWDRVQKTAIFVTHSIREAVLLSDRVLVMRRRPCTIVADVPVPFPRPRRMDLVDTPEFTALCARLRGHIESGSAVRPEAEAA